MRGFPPPPEVRLSFHDGSFYGWPQLRWTFSNIGQLVLTRTAWRWFGAARVLDGQATTVRTGLASTVDPATPPSSLIDPVFLPVMDAITEAVS
jgi:hypothetical protein